MINTRWSLRSTVVLVASLSAALTSAAPPATAPSLKPDYSSPLATWRTEKQALAAGDAAVLKHTHYTADAAEQKAIDAIMDCWAAQVKFQQACATKFGADAARKVGGGFNLEMPPDARQEVRGDRATLYNVGGPTPTRLVKVAGEWRITYESLVDNNFRDLPRLAPERLTKVFQSGVDLYVPLAKDVTGGKYASIDEVLTALRAGHEMRAKAIDAVIAE